MSTFRPHDDEETEMNPVYRESGYVKRKYLEEPLTIESGDSLTTYDDGTVEQFRNGEVIATTRWTSDKPAYMDTSTDSILDAEIIGEPRKD